MHKDLAASYVNEAQFQKLPEQHHVTREKSTASKLRNRQSKIFEKKQNPPDCSGTYTRNQPL